MDDNKDKAVDETYRTTYKEYVYSPQFPGKKRIYLIL
jgi:hypothetical protein